MDKQRIVEAAGRVEEARRMAHPETPKRIAETIDKYEAQKRNSTGVIPQAAASGFGAGSE